MPRWLSRSQISAFQRDGFLVLSDFWSSHVCGALQSRAHHLLSSMEMEEHRSVFSTKEQLRTSDDYFLTSGDKIRFFWEEDAFDEQGALVQTRHESVNKIGHALHDLDPLFQEHTYAPSIGAIAQDLGLVSPHAAQSMYIFKQPHIGGAVSPHQDGAFLYTTPQSVLGFWWALEECTRSNGCLMAVPGSHRLGVTRRFHRRPDGSGTMFTPAEPVEWDLTDAVALEVSRGSLVLLHHALVHYSAENRSGSSRHAYSMHAIDGDTTYPSDNWLQRPAFHSLV